MDEDKNLEGLRDIYIKQGHVLRRLRLIEIIWIKSDGNYCVLMAQDKKHVLKISLSRVLEGLPGDEFIQVHRSYAVRLDQIASIDVQSNVLFIGEEPIPVGRTYKELLLNRITML